VGEWNAALLLSVKDRCGLSITTDTYRMIVHVIKLRTSMKWFIVNICGAGLIVGVGFWWWLGVEPPAPAVTGDDPAADVDADGLPDRWERRYFGSLDEDADGDPDGDGMSNAEEWRRGPAFRPNRKTVVNTEPDPKLLRLSKQER